MEQDIILLDTGILIEYFRAKNKQETTFWNLINNYEVAISNITEYEFKIGFKNQEDSFLRQIMEFVEIFTFDSLSVKWAVAIYQSLKKQNLLIPANDIFIAAVALQKNIPLATFNLNHFQRIENLKILNLD